MSTTHETHHPQHEDAGTGEPVDVYRVPIPAADLEGVLCTEGVDQPGCVAPEGDAPRLWPAHARPAALCAHWGPRMLPGERWTCTDHGLALP